MWLLTTRALKLAPHFWHNPRHIVYLPAWIACVRAEVRYAEVIRFGYFFAVMKIYALVTLHETGWGTRAGVGDREPALDAGNGAELAALSPGARTPAWLERTDSDKRGSEKPLLDHRPPLPLLPTHGHYRASAQT